MQRKLRVLVVDDEQEIRKSLTLTLESVGYEVSTADDGASAMIALQNQFSDIVISDIRMPAMDGMTMVRRIKDTWPEITVILMTGYASKSTDKMAIFTGADDFITKPFKFQDLKRIIEKSFLRQIARKVI